MSVPITRLGLGALIASTAMFGGHTDDRLLIHPPARKDKKRGKDRGKVKRARKQSHGAKP